MSEKGQLNLKGIAKKLGVSVSTVSRVLSGQANKYRISKKTERAILDKILKLDFVPNELARGLKLNQTHTLGLIISDISNQFFSSIARYIEMEARKSGYSILLCDNEDNTDIEIESLNLMLSRKVDGIIISPVGQTSEHLEGIHKSGMPIVLVDRYFPDLEIPFVTSDNFRGAYDAVSYLIEKGHRRIACIQGARGASSSIDRVRGYEESLRSHNIAIDTKLIVGNGFDQRNGYIETKLLLKMKDRPTAIFSVGNLISFGAICAITEEKLNIPKDISIVSFDEQPYLAYLSTPLTTVAQQNSEMGQIAVKLLLDQIESGSKPLSGGIFLPQD